MYIGCTLEQSFEAAAKNFQNTWRLKKTNCLSYINYLPVHIIAPKKFLAASTTASQSEKNSLVLGGAKLLLTAGNQAFSRKLVKQFISRGWLSLKSFDNSWDC